MVLDRKLKTNNSDASTTDLPETSAKPPTIPPRRFLRPARWGHIFTGVWAAIAAIATAGNLELVQKLEYQTQNLFFELRGPVDPPDNILILGIDDESLIQGREIYPTDPKKYAYFEPLQAWPWKRAAYAQAIDKLMAAGARSVAVDVLFDTPSRYGAGDDERLRQVLQRYAGRVTLAASYERLQMRQGTLVKLVLPDPQFWTEPMSMGSIDYPLEADGKIHRFANEYTKQLAEQYKQQLKNYDPLQVKIPFFDFDRAALQAAQLKYPQPKGDRIYFYGPARSFKHIPFSYVLDPVNWKTVKEQFKGKIVLIGATASELNDFHKTPFSENWMYPERMSGVEIHAASIATLMQGRAIAPAIPNTVLRGIFVLMGIVGIGLILSKQKGYLNRFGWTIGIIITWGSISYIASVHSQLILPTAVPVVAIGLASLSYLTTEAAEQKVKKRQLRHALEKYATSPIIQEIISQQEDLQDILSKQDVAGANKKIGGRYEIIKVLGAGGFGETYIAHDSHRPGNPLCVVKQLKPDISNPRHLQLARRLFPREAEALEKLGQHNHIPQLLAYFEENEQFHLVQEFIDGHSLEDELPIGTQLPEAEVINILVELLTILEFVHSHNVIHRDIKPNNIIRRHSDNKLVLIDFGAVKEISTQVLNSEGATRFTVAIGTQGYAPQEQCAGRPRPNSDIYAVGITAVRALTGVSPSQLLQDIKTGEILWTHKAEISPGLAAIISKMVRQDFTQRYQSASEAKEDLLQLTNFFTSSLSPTDRSIDTASSEEFDGATEEWSVESNTLFPSE